MALLSVLTGTFRRHGSLLRPLAGVAAVVGLLALELLVQDMAARDNRLLALVWIQAILPGMVCGWLLLGPPLVAALARFGDAGVTRRSGTHPGGPAMTPAVTLSLYIARQFTAWVLAMLAALTGLVSLFDFIELLRRSATHPEASFALVAGIEALRLPYIAMQVLPFAALLGGMMSFWRLTRSSELIVARAAGVSAWEFLTAPVLCALLLGSFATAAISPVSSAMFARAETLANTFLSVSGGPLDVTNGQLWLRQADRGLTPRGVAIVHAADVTLHEQTLTATTVTVFRLNDADQLLSRIEATRARLAGGDWTLDQARAVQARRGSGPARAPSSCRPILRWRGCRKVSPRPTRCRFGNCRGSSALLRRSGFSSIRHRLHFQALLALPLLMATMALVAAGFSMRPARRGGVARMIGSGVAAGFALFMISKMAEEFGQSGPSRWSWRPGFRRRPG